MELKLLGNLDYKKVKNVVTDALEVDLSEKDELIDIVQGLESELKETERKYNEMSDDNEMKSEVAHSIDILNKLIYDTKERITKCNRAEKLITDIQEIEKARGAEVVSAAGRLSRAAGDVLKIVGLSENKTLEQNTKFASAVIGMGHDSISDHFYGVFAIKDVSPIVEQTLIEERFASFTIKSRREVNFADVGFYVPDFHDKDGNIIPNNEEVKKDYCEYMKSLFASYQSLVDQNIPMEDARFVLPYSYHSNIIMGMDAHCIKDLIIKLTKTKYANISELREFGEKMYDIVKEQMPYLVPIIENAEVQEKDAVDNFLDEQIADKNKYLTDIKIPKMLNKPTDVDRRICLAALMRRYQYSKEMAEEVLDELIAKDPEFMEKLIKKIAFEGDGLELTQVSFTYQIPLSLAILTHLTRHRTHDIMTPDFVDLDKSRYVTPPKVKAICEEQYNKIYEETVKKYEQYKNEYGIREEDLIYFTLSGVIADSITNMDGKTLRHILRLRECTKAQWETRNMAYGIHNEINKLEGAENYSSILGATCTTQGICNEGKECCGKVYKLKNCKMPPKSE